MKMKRTLFFLALKLTICSCNPLRRTAGLPDSPHAVPGAHYASRQHPRGSGDWTYTNRFYRESGDRGHFSTEKLVNGIPYGKSGYRGSASLFEIEVTSGAQYLNIMANGGSGDVDLYVKYEMYPTKRSYDERSARQGNQEQIILENPKAGRYFIVVYGYSSYNNVGFEAEFK